jgi:hypothetical protein
VCCVCADELSPKATIVFASLDNSGTIGGEASTTPACAGFGTITNKTVTPELQDVGGGQCRMRLPFRAQNDGSCGPVRVASASVRFFFETPSNPLP